jgi:HD-GYP domain-containing protein (c-di-GMP phosphodiesterase class II)
VNRPPDSVPNRSQRHQLVHSLAVALRTAELCAPENATMQRVISDLGDALRSDDSLGGPQVLAIRNHTLFVNNERVPGVTADEIRSLLYAFDICSVNANNEERDLETLALRLRQHGVVHVTLEAPVVEQGSRVDDDTDPATAAQQDLTISGPQQEAAAAELQPTADPGVGSDSPDRACRQPLIEGRSAAALRTYSACLDVCREFQEAVQDLRQLGTRRLHRVTQSVVDQVLQDDGALLAMTTIKEFDDSLFTHSANVAILAVALGQRVGYERSRLGELCLAAFLHDLGKIELARDLLDKPDALTSEEWELMREHPVVSVNILLTQEHLNPSTLRAIISGYEHHLNYDLTGYPRPRQKRHISLFGRIISVVDRYDAMTSPRAYRQRTITPHEAVLYLIGNAGAQLDPTLVRLFVDLVGLYPSGTAITLDTGEDAVVQQPPAAGSQLRRPQVCVLEGPRKGFVLDLAEQRDNGTYVCSIVSVLQPQRVGQVYGFDQVLFSVA